LVIGLTGIMHMERTALTLRVNAWIGRGLPPKAGKRRGLPAFGRFARLWRAAFRGVSPSTSLGINDPAPNAGCRHLMHNPGLTGIMHCEREMVTYGVMSPRVPRLRSG